jgi:hypothetical protein
VFVAAAEVSAVSLVLIEVLLPPHNKCLPPCSFLSFNALACLVDKNLLSKISC